MSLDARSIGPAPRHVVAISRVDALRVERLVTRVGWRGAALILNIGQATLESAREEGTMQPKTLERILMVLDIVDGWSR